MTHNFLQQLKNWIEALRPPTLLMGIGPVFLGATISFNQTGTLSFLLNGVIVFCVLCIQIATHFFNDALDFLKGADGINRLGPKRAVLKKLITPSAMLKAGCFCLVLAGLSGLFLVAKGGLVIFIIGVVSLMLTYLYTGGPWSLSYTGLSDVFVLLFFGIIPVMGVVYLNTTSWSVDSLVAGTQCGFLAWSVLLVNHLRDEKEDRRAGKKTLVVRYGRHFGFVQWSFVRYMPYILSFYWFVQAHYFSAFLPFLFLPLSFILHSFLFKAFENNYVYQYVLKGACVHHFLFVGALGVSFLISN